MVSSQSSDASVGWSPVSFFMVLFAHSDNVTIQFQEGNMHGC